MIQRRTWVKLTDSSHVHWIVVFHLYGGFKRLVSRTGFRVKGSVRVIQPMLDPYKGFKIKRINKGETSPALLVRQAFNYQHRTGAMFRTSKNGALLLKNTKEILAKHCLGPCLTLVRKKKILQLFKTNI